MSLLISVTYVDVYGRTTARRVGTVSTTLAAAAIDAAALIAAMVDVSDLGTIKYEIGGTTAAAGSAQAGQQRGRRRDAHRRARQRKTLPVPDPGHQGLHAQC